MDLIESVKRRVDFYNESDPVKKSKLFKETFSNFYIEQFKRVFEYMNGWDQFSKEDIGLADGLLGTLFPDIVAEGFEYYGRDKNSNVINPYVEGHLINLCKLHKELNRIQGPDDSLAIERYTSTNPAPTRNVKKDYFNKVLKEYIGFTTEKDEEINRCISLIKKYLGEKDKYDKSEVINLITSIKDIPNKLTNTLFRTLNGIKDLNLFNCEEVEKLKSVYDTFDRVSNEVLGKSVKYKQNVLFHLLRKIGKEPNMEDLYIKGNKSTERLDEEIGKVFARLGWEFRPI